MHYRNGEEIRLGDRVRLANGEYGTVVFSVDTDEYSSEFPKELWSSYEQGVMVRTDLGALVLLSDPNEHDVSKVT